ncbi:MAG: protein kinase [Acidobacteriota bacterium]
MPPSQEDPPDTESLHPGRPSTCPNCGAKILDRAAGCLRCAATDSLGEVATQGARSASVPKEIAGYRVVRELGAGGMGTVYEAYDQEMNRPVALKVLSRHLSESAKADARFAREAWIGGRLNHVNLVRVYGRGEWQELSYYSMELVGGGSLHDVITRMKRDGRDETRGLEFGSREYLTWAIGKIIDAARGLDYAHRRGVVHRDIKPMNILLGTDPEVVKIADFGLAIDSESTRLTTVGRMLGTVAYMSPEQIRGRHDEIGVRTDIYALGVTLFEMLTLELPYAGKTQQLYLNAVMSSQHKRLTRLNKRVGRDLEIVLNKALEKKAKDRYATAGELAEDLENVLHFRPIRARPPTPPAKLLKWTRQKPMQATLAAVLILGVPALSWLSVRFVQHRNLLGQVELERLWEDARRMMHEEFYPQAVVKLTAILASQLRNPEALRERALCYAKLAEDETVANRRAEYESLALGDISAVIDQIPDASWPYRVRAQILASIGRADEAREDEEAAGRLRAASPGIDDLHAEGLLAYMAGDYQRAVDQFTDLIVMQPDAVLARGTRALAYERLGDRIRARADYEVVTALNPDNFYPHYRLGRMLTRAGEIAEGEARLRRALELAPENPHVYDALSVTLIRQARMKAERDDPDAALASYREAERLLRRALEIDPDFPSAHSNLGAMLVDMNLLMKSPSAAPVQEAMRHYDRAITLWKTPGSESAPRGPGYGEALINRCDGLIELRDVDRALAACRQVTEFLPEDPDTFYNLAGAYALANRIDEALDALERDFTLGDTDHEYLASDPWFEPLREDPRFTSLLDRMKRAASEEAGG